MKLLRIFVALSSVLLATTLNVEPLLAQVNNDCTTVVLHATPGIQTSCQTSFDCTAVQPTTRLDNPAGIYTVYMCLKNYEAVSAVQVAFDWPLSWSFGFSLWQCQGTQISASIPTAPGPQTGTIATAFNQITGGALAPIGVMVFNSLGNEGCLSIIESSYPFGNCVVANYGAQITHLLDANEGRICVNADGWNTCDCRGATPIEGTSWGRIKASYGP